MVCRMYGAIVILLMVLSLAQPQRVVRCKRNVRCPCGYTSGGVTQDRFCGPEKYLNPECCTDSKIPPFIIPLSPRQRRNTRTHNLDGLSRQSGSSLNGVPSEPVDESQSSLRSNRKVPRDASSGAHNLMSTLVHANKGPTEKNDTHADLIKRDWRVIGGDRSRALKHAWLVFITFEERRRGSGTPICGGTLISSLFVLTTAHCFFESDGSRRSVKKVDLGRFDLNNNQEDHSFSRRARDFFVHPGYNQFIRTQIDDIALILLDAPSINGDGYVLPAFLPSDTEDPFRFDDLWARVAGWGGQGPRETFNPTVRETCMQVKSHCCEHHFQNFIPGKQMCFLGPYDTDICAGDSGSPFVVQGFNGPTVVALVSYGSFECGDNKPTINTAVQYYVPWIRNILREKEPFYDLNQKQDVTYADIKCLEFSCTF